MGCGFRLYPVFVIVGPVFLPPHFRHFAPTHSHPAGPPRHPYMHLAPTTPPTHLHLAPPFLPHIHTHTHTCTALPQACLRATATI